MIKQRCTILVQRGCLILQLDSRTFLKRFIQFGYFLFLCHFALFVDPALCKQLSCAADHVALSHSYEQCRTTKGRSIVALESFIFLSAHSWAFWINGVVVTSQNPQTDYLQSLGFRLLAVSSKGVEVVPLFFEESPEGECSVLPSKQGLQEKLLLVPATCARFREGKQKLLQGFNQQLRKNI